jgi:thymidylate synthase ThyX
MSYTVQILADSVSPGGVRLTTMQVTYPRIIHAEFMTHRVFSRNSASSRAIPVGTMLRRVAEDPFLPVYWGKNQKGMQADRELDDHERTVATDRWLRARDLAVASVEQLLTLGVHKQIANRLLEPFLWHTVIVTATEWDNFYGLRCHRDAQPEIRVAAQLMRDAHDASTPVQILDSGWHLPLVPDLEALITAGHLIEEIARISCARCARVSYLTHDGQRDPKADIDLADRLQTSGHMSPFEHAATPGRAKFYGNFWGWEQYRKRLHGEDVFGRTA